MISIRETLEKLHPDQPFELCIITSAKKKCSAWEGWANNLAAGWFTDHAKAVNLIERAEREAMPKAVYMTLNPTSPALLSRANNRLKGGVSRTSDKDIKNIVRLLIDVDPERPTDISSTNAELERAKILARDIYNFLDQEDWPKASTGCSGNGFHIVYNVDLSFDGAPLIKEVLNALADKFDTEKTKIDRSVHNPSRLFKLWGTMARKGDNTPERPHRQSAVLQVGSDDIVSKDQLISLVEKLNNEKPEKSTDKKTTESGGLLDIESYLVDHDIKLAGIKKIGDGATLFILNKCLFDPSHEGKEAAIGQQPNGTLFYQCFHNSCLEHTWKEARKIISGKELLTRYINSPGIDDMIGSEEARSSRKEYEDQIAVENDFDSLMTIAEAINKNGLPSTHKDRLIKQIASKAKISLKALRTDLSTATDGTEDSMPFAIVKRVIDDVGNDNILFAGETFYIWSNTGVWPETDDRSIKKLIHKNAPKDKLTQSAVASTLDLLKTETFIQDHRFNIDKAGINCLNGVLQWGGGKWVLAPHKKGSFSTTQIPVAYDPAAKAPRTEQFLKEITAGDEEQNSKIWLLLEMLGYCLTTSTAYEAFFFFIGPGANGKSVWMAIIRKLAGPDNVAAVQPSQLGNKFQRAHLNNKLVNLVTEIEVGHQVDDAAIKAITSGEVTTVERKYAGPFEMEPYATCVFGTNHLPHTRDFSDALQRRAYIINFNRVFDPGEQDKHLIDKLSKELPGILNLALRGLSSLYINGGFTQVKEVEAARKTWRLESDQVAQFVDGECDLAAEHQLPLKQLFSAYRYWGRETGITRLVNKRNFVDRLKRFGIGTKRGAQGQRFLVGVKLKSESELNMFLE